MYSSVCVLFFTHTCVCVRMYLSTFVTFPSDSSAELSTMASCRGRLRISHEWNQPSKDTLRSSTGHAKTSHDTPDELGQLMTIHNVSPRQSRIHTLCVCMCTCISAICGVCWCILCFHLFSRLVVDCIASMSVLCIKLANRIAHSQIESSLASFFGLPMHYW